MKVGVKIIISCECLCFFVWVLYIYKVVSHHPWTLNSHQSWAFVCVRTANWFRRRICEHNTARVSSQVAQTTFICLRAKNLSCSCARNVVSKGPTLYGPFLMLNLSKSILTNIKIKLVCAMELNFVCFTYVEKRLSEWARYVLRACEAILLGQQIHFTIPPVPFYDHFNGTFRMQLKLYWMESLPYRIVFYAVRG